MTAEIEMNSSNLLKKYISVNISFYFCARTTCKTEKKYISLFFGLLIYCTFLKGESCNLIVMFKAHVLLAQTLSLKFIALTWLHSSFKN